ncbi:pentatricopeptide repeat-containing protein At4g38150-like [Durio zibethinus]|uniref:Pentatricopeptide repeat-containing protein At4g38150-like n=1 Tax=Durio zibethinus TaxID=66656 RepID=A0A6P6AGB7_DURZI|nr:pentatricopeptide repeat-containing protein At4g38150-like [Durio zibethinus]
MESSQAWVFTKLIKMLTLKLHHPIPRAPPSLYLLQTRLFSDIRRPVRDSERSSFNSNGDSDKAPEPIPDRPLRGQRPLNPSSRETKGATLNSNGSSFQSPNTKFTSGPDKKREDSQSDVNFLEKFKLGLDNKREKQPSYLEAAAQVRIKEQEEKLSPPQDANEIFKKMKETGLIPNAVAMLDGLCKDGLIQEAMKLFGSMREKGTIPEVVIYTAVVDGFCKAHKLDDAKRIFRKMQSKGVIPNAFTYTVLIQGLYKCNQLDDAIEFCLEMLEAGHSPNVTTFVGLVDRLCKEKGVEEAETVIGTLKQKGFVVDDKAVRKFLDTKAPFSPLVWEAIFGKKTSQRTF